MKEVLILYFIMRIQSDTTEAHYPLFLIENVVAV